MNDTLSFISPTKMEIHGCSFYPEILHISNTPLIYNIKDV